MGLQRPTRRRRKDEAMSVLEKGEERSLSRAALSPELHEKKSEESGDLS